jgi:very-short-patch-repair endonuclease
MDAAIAELARRQHGVVARRQLRDMGVGRQAIDHRLREARLHAVHRGVYAVGHTVLSRRGVWMAATLVTDDAVLSHRAAGALWGVRPDHGSLTDIVVTRAWKPRPRVQLHRMTLRDDEITRYDGIPVTDLVARYPGRAGTPAVRRLLERRDIGRNITKRELELRFLAFLDAHRIPRPHVNARVDGREVDCLWPEQRLIAELDGFATHGTRTAFETDRARDRALLLAGYRVTRITWRQLAQEPKALAAELDGLLSPRGSR